MFTPVILLSFELSLALLVFMVQAARNAEAHCLVDRPRSFDHKPVTDLCDAHPAAAMCGGSRLRMR
jgi:hypothetical protein